MDQNSLRLKVVRLAQRSRRAIRLYTSVHNNSTYTSYSSGLPSDTVSYSSASSSHGSNVYVSPSLEDSFKFTNQSIIDDFAISNGESHTLGRVSMAALSTKGASSKSFRNSGEQFSEMQASEWREVNLSLLRALTAALEEPRHKELPKRILLIRDAFGSEWRNLKMLLQNNRSEAISAAERSDFIKLATLSEGLVCLKARCQASEAAFNELSELCKGIACNTDSSANIWELRPSHPRANTTPFGRSGSNINDPHNPDQHQIFQATSTSATGTSGIGALASKNMGLAPKTFREISSVRPEQVEINAPVRSDLVGSEPTSDQEHSNGSASSMAPEDDQKVVILRVAYN